MRNIWLVLKHDVGVTFRQRSFWLITILMPLFLVGTQLYALIQDEGLSATAAETAEAEEGEGGETAEPNPALPIALVDEADLIAAIPPSLVEHPFQPYADREAALAALDNGEVQQVVVVPADYVDSGDVTVYAANFRIQQDPAAMGVAFGNSGWMLQSILNYNLVQDEQTLRLLQNPTPGMLATHHALQQDEPVADAATQTTARLVASIMPYIFYFLLIMASSYMLRSVVAEKENRTVEVLLLSLPPRQLMLGKIVAMSVVLLVQLLIWGGAAVLLLNRSEMLLNIANFTFPPGFWVWAVLFLVLGFLLFAAIMAAAGALSTNAREGGQITWVLIIPLMPTLMFGSLFVEDPGNAFVVGLSLFPLSAPSAMVTRLAVSPAPLWQILLSLAGLAATTYGFIWLAGRFFRSGNLLSDTAFSWKRFATAWR